MNGADEHGRSRQGHTAAFALLRMDRTKLFVPRDEIRVLELAVDMTRDDPPRGAVGWITVGPQRLPVYCMSQELEWTTSVPADRPICAVLAGGGEAFGLLCSESSMLDGHSFSLHEVPAAMATPEAPFDRLAIHEDTIACVTSVVTLLAARTRSCAATSGAC